MYFNESVSKDKQGAAHLFASNFSSVYSNDQSELNLDDFNIPPIDLPINISFSINDVLNSLHSYSMAYRPLTLMVFFKF